MRRRFWIALAIYSVAHLYVWWRLALPLPSPTWQVATAIMAGLAPSFPVIALLRHRLGRRRGRSLLLVGYIWFGLLIYLLLAALASHVAVGLGADPGRMAQVWTAIAIAVVVAGLVNVALGPRVRRVRLDLPRLPRAQYTIVQLTDVHVGTLIGREFVETLVRRVNAVKPDLIVITGDLVDGPLADLRPHVEPLRDLRARDGVYAVTGNHEYYWNVEPWLLHLESLGIRFLRNEHVTIADTLVLAGVDDASFGEDVPRAVAGRPAAVLRGRRVEGLPLVLLAHHPRTVRRAIAAGVDLQLSGHTHGGQMLPWGWLARIWDPVVSGLRRFGDTALYVSDGTGYWGPPLRVGTRCEITVVTARPPAA